MKALKWLFIYLFTPYLLVIAQDIISYNSGNSPIASFNNAKLTIDSANTVWLAAGERLYSFKDNNWKQEDSLIIDGNVFRFMDLTVSDNGIIWAGINSSNENKLMKIDGSNTCINLPSDLHYVKNILVESDSVIWYVKENFWEHSHGMDKIGVVIGDSVKEFFGNDHLWIRNIAFDSQGRLLIATGRYGVTILSGDSLIVENPEGGYTDNVKSINGKSFVYGNTFSIEENGEFIPVDEINNFIESMSTSISAITMDSHENIWIGLENGTVFGWNGELNNIHDFHTKPVQDIEVDMNGNVWYLIEDNCCMLTPSDPVGILSERVKPESFNLLQNYPNPFNPATTIKFSIPNDSHVSLVIFNSIGQQLATLINEVITEGIYEVKFDGSNLSSGIYYCRVVMDTQVKFIKMILMK